ncbi:S8 family serine peptidase [Sphingomonas immobilis]|uniref:S8 family serine peptidase n=1 Tax=Sphingomonas immobilis TaxID=3063997 RepID=A0ABT9A3C4_9SPHN|nr:S8 family serine peptidase [Sphingomonas sp. CA1-15]MDO7844038.1 S8 family serine peptidase [Sphingomonas sp. CA1-15]
MIRRAFTAAIVCGLLASTPLSAQTAPPARIVVKTRDDLPRYSYRLPGTAVAMLNADDATFAAFAKPIAADIDKTLSGYSIADHAAQRGLLNDRLAYEVITHQDRAGLATIAQVRALQDKPDAKLTSGLRTEAILKARIATGASSGPAYEKAYADTYTAALTALPWAVVANTIKETKSNTQVLSASLAEGVVKSDIEPAVAKEGAISDRLVGGLLWARMARTVEIPLKDISTKALTSYVAANNVAKPDIWGARDVELTAADKLTPVVVGVWDSGVDLALFPQQTYTDPKPAPGLPYNAHGLAFDVDIRPSTGPLYPLTPEQAQKYPTTLADFQGMADLQQSIDSPAADAFKTKMSGLPSDQVPAFFESLNFYGNYLHGTHVAGIIARGNPAVRLAAARLTYDHRNVPSPPNEDLSKRGAAAYGTYVEWFKTHGVRVVNMSWGGAPSNFEHDLEVNGIGKDPAERKAMARKFFEIERNGLYAAIKGAPDILFVAAAGNSNSDNGFDESIPSSFVLPNLLTVSAVDRAGDEASFTSYGKNVVVNANGYQVDSTVPGGARLKESGTSMASPNVVNLAAKLIALDPTLTPEKTIALIRDTATPSADGRRHNIDPKAAVALLHKK